jgi:predicted site-specific integrase-resolvase
MRAKRHRRLARKRAQRSYKQVIKHLAQGIAQAEDAEFLAMLKNIEHMRACVNAPLRAEHLTFFCPLCNQVGGHADGCRLRGIA